MSTKSIKTDKNKQVYSNNVYVSTETRKVLEDIVIEVGYRRGKVMSASAFVRYLIVNYGVDAKNKILDNG